MMGFEVDLANQVRGKTFAGATCLLFLLEEPAKPIAMTIIPAVNWRLGIKHVSASTLNLEPSHRSVQPTNSRAQSAKSRMCRLSFLEVPPSNADP